jgi:hypothetical protein
MSERGRTVRRLPLGVPTRRTAVARVERALRRCARALSARALSALSCAGRRADDGEGNQGVRHPGGQPAGHVSCPMTSAVIRLTSRHFRDLSRAWACPALAPPLLNIAMVGRNKRGAHLQPRGLSPFSRFQVWCPVSPRRTGISPAVAAFATQFIPLPSKQVWCPVFPFGEGSKLGGERPPRPHRSGAVLPRSAGLSTPRRPDAR